MTNWFLGGKFMDYGSRVVAAYREGLINPNLPGPMDHVFPKMTKCQFVRYGYGGGHIVRRQSMPWACGLYSFFMQNHDALCLLPLNIVNEKIYLLVLYNHLMFPLLCADVVLDDLLGGGE